MLTKARNILFFTFLIYAFTLHSQTNRLYTTQQGMQTCDINSLMLDSRGLLWIGGGSPLCYFGGTQFHYLDNHSPKTGKTLYNRVYEIVEDRDDCYWVMTDGGLFRFNSRSLAYERFALTPEETDEHAYPVHQMIDLDREGKKKLVLTDGYGIYVLDNIGKYIDAKLTKSLQELAQEGFVTRACLDSEDGLWLSRISRLPICIDMQTMKEKEITYTPEALGIASAYRATDIIEVPARDAIYIATSGGLLKYERKENRVITVEGSQRIPFTSLLYTSSGKLLAGSDSQGLWTIDKDDRVVPYKLQEAYFDLSKAKVKDITMDRQGNIIVGLMQKGLYIIPKESTDLQYYTVSLSGDGRNTCSITSMMLDEQGRYWVTTDGAGVFLSEEGRIDNVKPLNAGLNSMQVLSAVADMRGTIWVGSYGGGIQALAPGANEFTTPDWIAPIGKAPIMKLCYDQSKDRIYAATNGMGVYELDLATKEYRNLIYNDMQIAWIEDLYMDEDGTLWICEVNNIYYINSRTGKRGMIDKDVLPGQPVCLSSLGKEKDKHLIVGTHNGLLIYDPWHKGAQHLLADKKVLSINCTDEYIWAATSGAIYAINRENMQVKEYSKFGGYFLGEFHKHSTLTDRQGNLLWGCDNGILSFNPQTVHQPSTLHNKIVLTALVAEGHPISCLTDPDIIDGSLLSAQTIRLRNESSSFSLAFGIPDFGGASNITYQYMLEGYDQEWNTISIPHLRFSVLPHGTYTLHIKACTDGIPVDSTERTITIQVAAPWYLTWWAYLIYMLVSLLAVLGIVHAIKIRKHHHMEVEALKHNEEIKEAKLQLFTSIAHELRTPITMIITPLRHILSSTEDDTLRKNLSIMEQNCNRILNTVRQITDIRRIDAGQFRLHFEEQNICQYTERIMQSFMGAAMIKKLSLSVENSEQDIYAWIDPIHFEKVLSNLLSNAFKFTPENGHILLRNRIKDNDLEISVYNEGEHIREEDMAHLYERFFQSNSGKESMGSGIGLNLCFELVRLHHGTIEARNVEPSGVEFLVRLPLGCNHLTAEELMPRTESKTPAEDQDSIQVQQEILAETTNALDVANREESFAPSEGKPEEQRRSKPILLIVDDDADIRTYLAEQFEKDFSVITASGGNMAWGIALQQRPDIVITDVMMPDGDGIELTRRIKANPELDNTPIIMVTGEDNDSLQLQSLQLNVDHFLQKPFNVSILRATINQAMRVRENIRRHTQRTEFGYEVGKPEMESVEDNLYTRITKTLQEHLDDSDYNVQELANEVGISRVHLNRKMKERFGLSPNAFIRSFRLKQAAYLLIHNNVNVSEVAYKVGFSTHSHFSSSFRDYFGMTPKDFVAFYKQEENREAFRKLIE